MSLTTELAVGYRPAPGPAYTLSAEGNDKKEKGKRKKEKEKKVRKYQGNCKKEKKGERAKGVKKNTATAKSTRKNGHKRGNTKANGRDRQVSRYDEKSITSAADTEVNERSHFQPIARKKSTTRSRYGKQPPPPLGRFHVRSWHDS